MIKKGILSGNRSTACDSINSKVVNPNGSSQQVYHSLTMSNLGTVSYGVKCPIFREGDDIINIITDSVLEASSEIGLPMEDKSVVGITESVISRVAGNYVTVDEIAEDVKETFGENKRICVFLPIFSRNRFAICLRGIARAAKSIDLTVQDIDEKGNVIKDHPFTKMDYLQYYKDICESEGCEVTVNSGFDADGVIVCVIHEREEIKARVRKMVKGLVIDLTQICNDKCEYGLLGSNKATEEKLKLFPSKEQAKTVCEGVKALLKEKTGKDVIVVSYGDGCFHSPFLYNEDGFIIPGTSIYEFADPVTMPYYTDAAIIESTPNEIKIKAFADDKYGNLNGNELNDAIREEVKNNKADLKGNMAAQGTTPRMYRDLIASLMDLTTGSGSKATPVVVLQNYFKDFSD